MDTVSTIIIDYDDFRGRSEPAQRQIRETNGQLCPKLMIDLAVPNDILTAISRSQDVNRHTEQGPFRCMVGIIENSRFKTRLAGLVATESRFSCAVNRQN